MQEKFVLDLTHLSWAIVDETGHIVQSAMQDEAIGLAEITEGREVIVLVPSEEVLLTTCKLPKMSKHKMMSAIPFALEDQVIDEVDQLHFAFFQRNEKNSADGIELLVLVVAHAKMQLWLSTLKTLNIKPDKLLPTVLALPDTPLNILVTEENILVRNGEYSGFACDKTNILFYLTSMGSQSNTVIHNYTNHALQLPDVNDERFLSKDQYIGDLAQEVAKISNINLLQGGHYAVKSSKFNTQRNFSRMTLYLAFVCVGLLLIQPLCSYFILKSRVKVLDEEIAQLYKQQFPHSSALIAPRARLEEKLAKLKSNHGEDRFLILLAHISKALQADPNIKLKRFDFQNNQLNLRVMAKSSNDISNFTNFLINQGLKVKQQNATVAKANIYAALQIE